MNPTINSSIERIRIAYQDAITKEFKSELKDFDPCWLYTELDSWTIMPKKIEDYSKYAQIQVKVYWEQQFKIDAYPKLLFPTLTDLFNHYYYQFSNSKIYRDTMYGGTQWHRLFFNPSLEFNLKYQRELWDLFLKEQNAIEIDEAFYLDIAELLQNTCCHWTGHWIFNNVVLDKYKNGEIDYNSFIISHFHEKESVVRFIEFQNYMRTIEMNREKTWTLFTPSGERIYKVIAIYSYDGNAQGLLLESQHEFLDFHASGS